MDEHALVLGLVDEVAGFEDPLTLAAADHDQSSESAEMESNQNV